MCGRPRLFQGGDIMVDVSTALCGLALDNPVIPASGTFGFGKEFKDLYDLNILGSFVTKGITLEERYGNESPRVAECPAGMLNSVGLQNPGVEKVLKREFNELKAYYKKPVVANISGFSVEEYAAVAAKIDGVAQVGIIEVNVSCPNVSHGGMSFGTDAKSLAEVTRAVKAATTKPVFLKLTPNVTSIVDLALAARDAGADGLSLINTLLGARIDLRTRKFVLANRFGGYSGYGVFPVALRMVAECYKATSLPIMGMGGVTNAEGVIEMMLAGASAVQIGAANLVNPYVCKEIVEDLPRVMEKYGITSLKEIIGEAVNG